MFKTIFLIFIPPFFKLNKKTKKALDRERIFVKLLLVIRIIIDNQDEKRDC